MVSFKEDSIYGYDDTFPIPFNRYFNLLSGEVGTTRDTVTFAGLITPTHCYHAALTCHFYFSAVTVSNVSIARG